MARLQYINRRIVPYKLETYEALIPNFCRRLHFDNFGNDNNSTNGKSFGAEFWKIKERFFFKFLPVFVILTLEMSQYVLFVRKLICKMLTIRRMWTTHFMQGRRKVWNIGGANLYWTLKKVGGAIMSAPILNWKHRESLVRLDNWVSKHTYTLKVIKRVHRLFMVVIRLAYKLHFSYCVWNVCNKIRSSR